MGKNSPEILAYITSDEHRVKTGNPLTLIIADENERKSCVAGFIYLWNNCEGF